MKKLILTVLVATFAFGCSETTPDDSSRDETFMSADGKSDAFGIRENSVDANGILALVDDADEQQLDVSIGLDRRAASNIADHKAEHGRIETLSELDAIPYVGVAAFRSLFRYAVRHGYMRLASHGIEENSPVGIKILQVVNTATESELDDDVELDARAASNIVAFRETNGDIQSLQELDEISYVSASAFRKLKAFVTSPLSQDTIDQLLGDMADVIGEYFLYEDSRYANLVDEVSTRTLPENVAQVGADAVRDAEVHFDPDFPEDRFDAEVAMAFTITFEGEVVGYVLAIDYFFDHPLHDGSGEHLYVNLDGETIASVSWEG